MRRLDQYQCEICHTIYNDENNANKCEENHHTSYKVDELVYLPINVDSTGFPEKIKLKFLPSNKVVTYKRIK